MPLFGFIIIFIGILYSINIYTDGLSRYQMFTTRLSWPKEFTIILRYTEYLQIQKIIYCAFFLFFGNEKHSKYESREAERESVAITLTVNFTRHYHTDIFSTISMFNF